MNVAGKVALITGAAEGLGKAFTQELLKKQIKAVGMLDVQQTKGETAQKQLQNVYGDSKVHFIKCDVADKHQLDAAFKEIKDRFGQIDLVCNNAGIADESQWEKMVDINLTAVIQGCFLAIKYMSKENGGNGGVIINTSSMAGLESVPFSPVYAAVKHGVVGLSRSLADHPLLSSSGIRVNTLCPAFVDTAILQSGVPYGITRKKMDEIRSNFKVLPVSLAVEAFMKLVEEDRNGHVMRLTPTNGIDIKTYRPMVL